MKSVTPGGQSLPDFNQMCDRLNDLSPESYTALPREIEPALARQAIEAARRGDYQRAIGMFNQLIEQDANSATAYHNRGLAHFHIRQFTAAMADYTTALQLNPRLGKVYNSRGNCYAAMGDLIHAIIDYEAAIDLNPLDLQAWINRGITFRELKLHEIALENFDLALEFSQLLNQTENKEAISLLEGHIYAERGRTHELSGDWNWAVSDYQQALNTLPPSDQLGTALSRRLRLQVSQWLHALLSGLDN
ncbi:MAG TPA: tetratricopeptide repeat protein [Coleofasciculaceae cyanobacterium]